MRALVQRVSSSSVVVDDHTVGAIDKGLLVLLGVGQGDTEKDADYLLKKISELRIFEDEQGKMNLSVQDVGGSLLLVSQFTLYADTKKGRRPSFVGAASLEEGKRLYEYMVEEAKKLSIPIATGEFQAHMMVSLTNDGPVTIWMDTAD